MTYSCLLMKKAKILIIENSRDITGALKSVVRTSYDLQQFYEFHFIVRKAPKVKSWIRGKGFELLFELPMIEISQKFFDSLLYFPQLFINAIRLKKYIQRNEISLVHSNDLYNLLPPFVRILGSKVPYVCHVRFLPNRFPRWLVSIWMTFHFRFAAKIIGVSQSVLKMLPAHNKLFLIYNELPIEEKYSDTQKLNRNSDKVFLYLSNFIKGKGQNYALMAFTKVHDRLPNWRLRFVGGDMGLAKNSKYRKALESQADALGVKKKIEWKGFTDDVELEYKSADIVLNFSESESFSVVCLEAMFYGKPVIATDCGGPREIINHNETGLLVPNRNIDAMASAMIELAENNDKCLQFGARATSVVRDKFNVEKTSYKLKEVYDSVLNS